MNRSLVVSPADFGGSSPRKTEKWGDAYDNINADRGPARLPIRQRLLAFVEILSLQQVKLQ
jgi:hypothetical protein